MSRGPTGRSIAAGARVNGVVIPGTPARVARPALTPRDCGQRQPLEPVMDRLDSRPQVSGMMTARKPYPSDASDEEWALAVPYLTLLPETAGQRTHLLRE